MQIYIWLGFIKLEVFDVNGFISLFIYYSWEIKVIFFHLFNCVFFIYLYVLAVSFTSLISSILPIFYTEFKIIFLGILLWFWLRFSWCWFLIMIILMVIFLSWFCLICKFFLMLNILVVLFLIFISYLIILQPQFISWS